MRIAVCPGSFDPVTNGHLDIFERGSKIFDLLIVAVFHNPNKKPFFTMEERVEMLKAATAHIPNVEVDGFSGLLTEFVRKQNTTVIVRGLRALSDFEYEFQRALLIKSIDSDMETVFMMTSNEYSFVSSSGVKELAVFGGNISGLVPKPVEDLVFKRLKELRT
ncbi:MAG: pantetheine-phosphate adenylyltransferase [Negativicutes bacterium]|nr:pantetheine-phosphate adenylyltransferase [Negativicutes bacterium]